MQLLGHHKLDTSLLYIQVKKVLFSEDSGEFIVKIAKMSEEVKEPLEASFEYIREGWRNLPQKEEVMANGLETWLKVLNHVNAVEKVAEPSVVFSYAYC